MKQFQHNIGLLILRLGIGGLMLFHGFSKLSNGVEGLVNLFDKNGLPGFFAYAVYLGEVLAPLLIIIGFRTKIASLALVVTMFVAMFIAHDQEIFTLDNHGAWALEVIGLYISGGLALFFLGGGKLAVSNKNKWD